MENKKGQVLLVVFMLMIFVGIMVGGTAYLWQSGSNTSVLQKNSLRAFYLAQAGIERARAEIACHPSDVYSPTFTNQDLGGGTYDLTIVSGTGSDIDKKEIWSTGRFGNSTRRIYMRVGRDNTGVPVGNAWGWHRNNDDEWREE